MTPAQEKRIRRMILQGCKPRWTGSVATFCEKEVVFREPKLSGPFSFAGREYLRELADAWGDDSVKDMVGVMGTRTGKTRSVFGGLAWRIAHSPTRALWVMPNSHGTGGAQNVSRTRFQPMLRASPLLSAMIPKGAKRHEFKSLQMIINGSIIDLSGANSPANLAGNPCDCVIQDETDKYATRGEKEAHPSRLADERAKEFSNPKRVKFSTPTLYSGLIWQEFLKTDMRRREVPCPHCGKFVIFAWSPQHTVLPKTGKEAYVKWDRAAKLADGKWDEDKVMATAHAECPHCKGHIRDEHKVEMDRQGKWVPTKTASPGYRGWHLPSMYSVSTETTFGRMAVRFIQAQDSLLGIKSFINSDLAEPDIGQDSQSIRSELIALRVEMTAEWWPILTIDCQAKGPNFFWYVVRFWNGGDSNGVEAGPAGTWDDLRAAQLKHKVRDVDVIVDSGWGARDYAEVYAMCARYSTIQPPKPGKVPLLAGWIPSKGQPKYRTWRDEKTGLVLPWRYDEDRPIDPFSGTSDAGKVGMVLFEYSGDFFKDILHRLRSGKSKHKWCVVEAMATEEYWRHMDGETKATIVSRHSGATKHQWERRSKYWPNHLWDCETGQIAAASHRGLVEPNEPETKGE